MFSSAKAIATVRMIKDRINFRFADQSLSCAESFDSEGYPVILLSDGSAATTEKVILIRCKQEMSNSVDIFGNANKAYAPHVIQVGYEDGSALIASDWAKLVLEISKVGMKMEIFKATSGAIPALSDLVAAKLESALEFDVLWPTKGN